MSFINFQNFDLFFSETKGNQKLAQFALIQTLLRKIEQMCETANFVKK